MLTPKAAPPPVPPIIAAGEAASAKVRAAQNAAKSSGVTKAAGKLNTLLAGASLAAGLFSLVKVAREKGVTAAGAEALKAIDPTGGVVGKVLDKLNTDDAPAEGDLRSIARAQAEERQKAVEANTSEAIAREAAFLQRGGADPATMGVASGEAGIAQGIVAGHIEGAQAELVMRTLAASGGALASFYGGSTVGEIVARGEHAKLAADFAREGSNREPSPPEPSMARTAPVPQQADGPTGGPRGFAIPSVREQALAARKAKLGY